MPVAVNTFRGGARKVRASLGIQQDQLSHLVFDYLPARTIACSDLQPHIIDGLDGGWVMRRVIKLPELGISIGTGIGTVDKWIERGYFPRPLGRYSSSNFKRTQSPAYTLQEALTYSYLLTAWGKGEVQFRPFITHKDWAARLAAAREQILAEMRGAGVLWSEGEIPVGPLAQIEHWIKCEP